jgi:molecular chaperone GrpE (heat shock protein)
MEATDRNQNRPPAGEPSEVERLKEELRREHDLYLRALADFENYRKRVDRDRASAARSGKREIILPVLNVLDDFDRALQHIGDAPPPLAQAGPGQRRVGRVDLDRQDVRSCVIVGHCLDLRCPS